MVIAIIVLAFTTFIIGLFTGIACTVHNTSNKSKTKSYNISNKELNELVSKYYKDYSEVEFTEFVSDWLNGKVPPKQMKNNGGAMVVEPCKGPDCSCYPTREDHCDCMGADGMCHHMINLNLICGIHESAEEIIKKPELLTEEELQMLSEAIQSECEYRYDNADNTSNS